MLLRNQESKKPRGGSATWSDQLILRNEFFGITSSGKVKFWNGTDFVPGTIKHWNGSAWVTATVRYWNGSSWVALT